MRIKWKRLSSGNWMAYSEGYIAFLRRRVHYKREGFDKFWVHWTVFITKNKEYAASEGVFGTSLSTIIKAKKWTINAIKKLIHEPNTNA
jgi:hypothetical protein